MLYPALLGIFSMKKYSLTLPKPSPNPNIIIKYKILKAWGSQFVSTLEKGWSRQSRKSLHFQNLSLDNREVSIKIEKSWFCLDTTYQSQNSWSRLTKLLKPDIFGKSQQFVSMESGWLILSFILIEISQFVEIFEPEVPQKVLIMSRYLDKSRFVSTNLENLDSLDLSRRSR